MSLDAAAMLAAYDATCTAMHSNAGSILMLPLVTFKKNVGHAKCAQHCNASTAAGYSDAHHATHRELGP